MLDKHIFHSTLDEQPDRYREAPEGTLRIAAAYRGGKARFHGYDSSEHIVAVFGEEVHSELACPMHDRLKYLGLTTLPDIREQFLSSRGSEPR